MVFIDFQSYLMPAADYFSKDCYKPVNKCSVFLFFELAFLLAHHHQQVISQNIQLPENVVCPKVIGQCSYSHGVDVMSFIIEA